MALGGDPASILLLTLLPSDSMTWPENFALQRLKDASAFLELSSVYPRHRRQRRLSYVSSVLLEYAGFDKGIRQILLEIPSTRRRLSTILGRFELMNSQLMNGEFS
uniref:Uncharacterized protein n=1 Tax=Eucampia antarctica TaxID=49252 RepID=A0A7S2RS44_9STRA